MLPWKEILSAALGILIPMLYSWISGQFPDIPVDSNTFFTVLTWIVGLFIGGWQSLKGKLKYQVNEYNQAKLDKTMSVRRAA